MGLAVFFFLAALLSSTCHAEFDDDNPIRLPHYGADPSKINCQSFRVGVEAYNLRNWKTVPDYCKNYIRKYVTGKQYTLDMEAMTMAAAEFARTLPLPRDLRPNVWIFDLDETLISNLDFLASPAVQYGTLPFNDTSLHEWIASENSTAPELPAVKDLYDYVLSIGFKTVIVSEAPHSLREKRISDLKRAGYSNWDAVIFRSESENDLSNEEFKSNKITGLAKIGYRIISTVGDQWSDLVGDNYGRRSFKVPNPMYYVA